MRILSEKEDEELRKRLKEKYGLIGDPKKDWDPLNLGDRYYTDWRVHKENKEYMESFVDLLKGMNSDIYAVAYEGSQYLPDTKKTFKEKYKGRAIEVDPDEILDLEFISCYIVPEDLSWILLNDHEGALAFTGEIEAELLEIINEEHLHRKPKRQK